MPHPGLYTYVFELSRRARLVGRELPREVYPKVLAEPHPELPLGALAGALSLPSLKDE